jgi:hypothetical protein
MNHQNKVTNALYAALSECVRLLADCEGMKGEEGNAYRAGLRALSLCDEQRDERRMIP